MKSRQPRYHQVEILLREEIRRNHAAGDKLPSESRLARHFGVSLLTLREAMNSLAQDGLVDRQQGSGTFVRAVSPRSTVGVLLDHNIGQANFPFFSRRVFQEVRRLLNAEGYLARGYIGFKDFTATRDPGVTSPEFVEDIRAHRLQGLVIVGGALEDSLLREIERQGIPMVSMNSASTAGLQSLPLIAAGVQHLVGQGRRRLAMLGWSSRDAAVPLSTHVQEALAAHGLPYHPEWVRDDLHPAWPGAGWEVFREIWFCGEKPDGLLILDDVLSQGVASAIAELGIRVPDQLMVVSHANKGSGIEYPFPVSLLSMDPELHARHLATCMSNRLQGKPESEAPHLDLVPVLEPAHPVNEQGAPDPAATQRVADALKA